MGALRQTLELRLAEAAPGRIQLVTGPRQVGKTTLLLELAARHQARAIYAAADAPEAALPGFWERVWAQAEAVAVRERSAVVLLDEVHLFPNWSSRLKGEWDRLRRKRLPVQVIASGSSSLQLGLGSRESLAGRFERLTLAHWSAASIAAAFGVSNDEAVELAVRMGTYPGAFDLRTDPARWTAYVRDAIIEPALGRDILALTNVRRPALLRQVFAMCAASPAQIVSLQKLQGQLLDAGALETIAHYLALLEDAMLVAVLRKHAAKPARQRASPPKLVTLNNALLAATDHRGAPVQSADPARFGAWVENACLAHAWNSGQRVSYWREEPFEVDGVIDGSWGSWAIEIKTGAIGPSDLRGLGEFTRRFPEYGPLVLCEADAVVTVERAGFRAMSWREFLVQGLADSS